MNLSFITKFSNHFLEVDDKGFSTLTDPELKFRRVNVSVEDDNLIVRGSDQSQHPPLSLSKSRTW